MNKAFGFSVSTIAFLLVACNPAEIPAPNPTETATEIEVPKTGLSNIQVVGADEGFSAWLVTEPSIPIVAVNMAWPGGSATDPAGKTGATGLMVYMMNEGAGELDSNAFATRMEELNMTFGCSTGRDWTSCSMFTLSENFEAAMDLVRLGLTETRFDDAPFARAVEETLISVKRAETRPGSIAGRAIAEALYPEGHAYSMYETEESVQAVEKADLSARRDAIMTKQGLLVTAVGNISAEQLEKAMGSTFAALPDEGESIDIETITLGALPEDVIVRNLPQPQSFVSFIGQGVPRDHPDFFAAYVTNYILGGGGFSARLMDEIRENRGLTYGINSSLSDARFLATWGGGSQTANENVGEMVARIKAELHKLAIDGPTEKELADAKSYLTGAYPLAFDSNSKIAGQMMGVRQNGLGLDYFANRNDMVEAVTLEDVKRIAATYLKPENFTFVAVGQPEGLDQIDAIFEEAIAGE